MVAVGDEPLRESGYVIVSVEFADPYPNDHAYCHVSLFAPPPDAPSFVSVSTPDVYWSISTGETAVQLGHGT
jgi:hypothetical protein